MENTIDKNNIFESLSKTLGQEVTLGIPSKNFPLRIEAQQKIKSNEWGKRNKDTLNSLLLEYGAILLRGFEVEGAHDFNSFFLNLFGDTMEYKNRTSPRERVHDNIYTSTEHPKHQFINMHTENSYSPSFNRIIAFFCLIPPSEGGETPIADERKLLKWLKPETLDKFRTRKIQYLRNSMTGIGLDWKTIYQTDNREEVNQYLDANGFTYSWLG